jgi:8-amino-7-oxononanoate synthase
MPDDNFLDRKLDERKEQHAFRQLRLPIGMTDFCSNDYLGIATHDLLKIGPLRHGSTGSRLLAGNYSLIAETERLLAAFHAAEAGLIFNSGYDANLGVLSCIPRRGDTIFYDALSHASIRDGIRLSFARSFSFLHNDFTDLEKKLQTASDAGSGASGEIFVVTESVFSMDGDLAPLPELTALCRKYKARLIIDEAHATGVVGPKGAGLVQEKGLQEECFARIHTFGKAVGCHGAVVLGSHRLRDFLVNFSRPFIYTTALPPSSVQAIRAAYECFPGMKAERQHLQELIGRFQQTPLDFERLDSNTPIQAVIVPGNEAVRAAAEKLQAARLDVRPILYPTVPKGSERLRIVLHSFNTFGELDALTALLRNHPIC